MYNLSSNIIVNVSSEVVQQPTEEFKDALNELEYMKKHPEEYKIYHNIDEMINDILKKTP